MITKPIGNHVKVKIKPKRKTRKKSKQRKTKKELKQKKNQKLSNLSSTVMVKYKIELKISAQNKESKLKSLMMERNMKVRKDINNINKLHKHKSKKYDGKEFEQNANPGNEMKKNIITKI